MWGVGAGRGGGGGGEKKNQNKRAPEEAEEEECIGGRKGGKRKAQKKEGGGGEGGGGLDLKMIDDLKKYGGKLDSLQQTDKSIIKIDQLNYLYTFKLNKDFGKNNVLYFSIIIECISRNRGKKRETAEISDF
ncbi:MAG: hypothetical protein IPO02_11120 [Bacteroidetes bacterium]|nr:hypothetical protein [Bacteroidota bacterium]